MKYKSEIDVPVALVFFNRPEVLKKSFDAIRKARPSKLFLIQDGSRVGNNNDVNNVILCQNILKDIDWECDVNKNYSSDNLGCGLRISTGIAWAFEKVDRLIIIEDDCVGHKDFFTFSKEILEKYKDDERIDMISGMNILGESDIPDSYFFSHTGSIAGWATWRRAWDKIDFDLNFVDDRYAMSLLSKSDYYPKHVMKRVVKSLYTKRELLKKGERLTSWSGQRGASTILNSGLIVMPKKNLMTNIGLTSDSVHSVDSIKKVPVKLRKVYSKKMYNMEFPLKHPKYIIDAKVFDNEYHKIMNPKFLLSILRRIESIIRRIIFK